MERYPFLIPRDLGTDEIIGNNCRLGENLPKGWHGLFLQMCEEIRQPLIDADYLDKFRFSQIKEKYGTMKCHCLGAPESVLDILDKYEYISQFVCVNCGKPAIYTSNCILPYCNECVENVATEDIRYYGEIVNETET